MVRRRQSRRAPHATVPARQKQFARVDPGQLVEQALGGGRLGGAEIAGADVDEGQAEPVAAVASHCRHVVGRARFQRFFVENHPGRDDANHAPLDQALDQFGVFQLLADGHPMAQLGETGNIAARRVVGDPAHGHGILLALVAGGLGEREDARRVDRVLVEHLVEVPQAKEYDRVGILRLDLKVLAHERGGGLRRPSRGWQGPHPVRAGVSFAVHATSLGGGPAKDYSLAGAGAADRGLRGALAGVPRAALRSAFCFLRRSLYFFWLTRWRIFFERRLSCFPMREPLLGN